MSGPGDATDREAAPERARRFLPAAVAARIAAPEVTTLFSGGVELEPAWTGRGDRFTFVRRDPARGRELVLVDPDRRTVEPVVRVADLGEPEATDFRWAGDGASVSFTQGDRRLVMLDGQVFPDPWFDSGRPTSPSPSGDLAVRVDGRGNVRLLQGPDDDGLAVTDDAEPGCDYLPIGLTEIGEPRSAWGSGELWDASVSAPFASWSPDGRYVALARTDLRDVRRIALVDELGPSEDPQTLERLLHPLPGDRVIPTVAFRLLDVTTGTLVTPDIEPVEGLWHPMTRFTSLTWWDRRGPAFWFVREHRGFHTMSIHRVDAASGAHRVVFSETSDTVRLPALRRYPPAVAPVDDGIVVWSEERTGHGHLWLVRDDGSEVQLTDGAWQVDRLCLVRDDEIWFTARGREPGRDPYEALLYRTSLRGGDPVILAEEPGHHEVVATPSGGALLDTWATLTGLRIAMRDLDGAIALEIGSADLAPLRSSGWTPPRRCIVDGLSEGPVPVVEYRPTGFEAGRSYPVILDVYGVSSRTNAQYTMSLSHRYWHPQALAELGYVVLQIDGAGTPLRSKRYRDAAYGDALERGVGLDDQVEVVRRLTESLPYLDPDRVGVTGHSGGGLAAALAMVLHPDVFKVGVASAGNHDERIGWAGSGERWMGLPDERPSAWERQAVSFHARQLEGRLLLMHGGVDREVHVRSTLRLYRSLLDAGKGDHVDLAILPGFDHGITATHPTAMQLRWGYFLRHLPP